jgi:hypothetical protein
MSTDGDPASDATPRVSRRRLLQVGIVGAAILSGGSLIGRAMWRRAPLVGDRAALSAEGEEVVRAVAPVILGSLLDVSRSDHREALAAGIDALDDYLAHLSLPVQEEATRLFTTLSLLPARVLLLGSTKSWQDASPADVERFLRSARSSRFTLLRRIHGLLQSLVVVAWFDLPLAWEAIGYPGPPDPTRFSASRPA